MVKHTIQVGVDYVPYIVNGDATLFDYYGLPELQAHIDAFVNGLVERFGVGHFEQRFDCGGAIPLTGFCKCDATGDLTDCAVLSYVYQGV